MAPPFDPVEYMLDMPISYMPCHNDTEHDPHIWWTDCDPLGAAPLACVGIYTEDPDEIMRRAMAKDNGRWLVWFGTGKGTDT